MFAIKAQDRDWTLVAHCNRPLVSLGRLYSQPGFSGLSCLLRSLPQLLFSHPHLLQAQALTWLSPAILETTALPSCRHLVFSPANPPGHICHMNGRPGDESCDGPGSLNLVSPPPILTQSDLSSACRRACGHPAPGPVATALLPPFPRAPPNPGCPGHCDLLSPDTNSGCLWLTFSIRFQPTLSTCFSL